MTAYLADDMAQAAARMAVNAPLLSFAPGDVSYALATSLLSAINDVRYLIEKNAPNLYVATASGQYLAALAQNYGVVVPTGTPAVAQVQFSVPTAPTATRTIAAGTVVQAIGSGSNPGPVYQTTAAATISPGSTTSTTVPAVCASVGTFGNVGANQISFMVTIIAGVSVTNPHAVDGTSGTILGANAPSDDQVRASIYAVLYPAGTDSAVENAIIGVSGVYDALVVDPAAPPTNAPDGTITYYWADPNGTTPGLTFPGGVPTIAAGTLADTVDRAVRAAIKGGIVPSPAAFTIVDLHSSGDIAATYSAPSAVISAAIEPQIKATLVAYVQGLKHGQTPTTYGMIKALMSAGITQLTSFVLTSTLSSATSTTLYRSTGSPASVVSLTRV